jgi:hypothetical protein
MPVVLFGDCLTLWCVLMAHNENPPNALNTTSLKCCLPSTEAIDRRETFTHAYDG